MEWIPLNSIEQFQSLMDSGVEFGVLKHSTRCSISSMAKSRIERAWTPEIQTPLYLLSVLAHRDVSDEIARVSGIKHASPQFIFWKDGTVAYNASHSAISLDQIMA